jgi:hypothetical protein
MLVLVCVLECLDLTGLEVHEWLGFVLCPLILTHVILQWRWLVAQIQVLKRGFHRANVNALLNTLLLVVMSAVLVSGILASGQIISMVGERFGTVRIWREMHGWLNFVALVLVGLHLALNWDWVLGRFRRPRPERPPRPAAFRSTVGIIREQTQVMRATLGRSLAVIFAVLLSAALSYLVMSFFIKPAPMHPSIRPGIGVSTVVPPSRDQLLPQPRPVSLSHGTEQLMVTTGLIILLVLTGRYVFRLRL